MPHPSICTPCDCPGEGCLVCITPQVCGAAIPADIDLWDTDDCSTGGDGTLVASGSTTAEVGTWCHRVPGPGWYSVYVAPRDGAGCARCHKFQVLEADCSSEMGKSVVVPISPLTHDVTITVKGCCGCVLPGMAVTYDDGTATAGGTTGLDGTLTLTDLTAPCDPTGAEATITVTGKCGYQTKTVTVPVDVCSMPVEITLAVDGTHVCIGGIWPVNKTQTYVGAKSGSITLHWIGGDGCSGPQSFVGCGTYLASDAATPVVCTDDLYEACDQYRYESGAATVPVIIILNLYATCCQEYDDGGTPSHRQRLLWDVIKIMPMVNGCECGTPSPDGWRVVGEAWCYEPGGFGCNATATAITLDEACNFVGCGYSPGFDLFPAGWGSDESFGRCVHVNFGYVRYERLCEAVHYTAPGVYTTDTLSTLVDLDCEDCWTGTVLSGTTDPNYGDAIPGCVEPGNPFSPVGPSIPEFTEGYTVTLA